jgi:hypothetical protein
MWNVILVLVGCLDLISLYFVPYFCVVSHCEGFVHYLCMYLCTICVCICALSVYVFVHCLYTYLCTICVCICALSVYVFVHYLYTYLCTICVLICALSVYLFVHYLYVFVHYLCTYLCTICVHVCIVAFAWSLSSRTCSAKSAAWQQIALNGKVLSVYSATNYLSKQMLFNNYIGGSNENLKCLLIY